MAPWLCVYPLKPPPPLPLPPGEPHGWPHVNSGYGQIDLSGILKAPAYWFRAHWLANVSATDAGRPPLPQASAAAVVRIVELWAPPTKPGGTRAINVYTNAPLVQLVVNGAPVGTPVSPAAGVASFPTVVFAPGTIEARALASDGATVLATHARHSWGAPVRLLLSLDAPSLATGTGSAVYLDGADVALVRATVLDAAGNVVSSGVGSTVNITFSVTDGPGLVVGCGNGDPANLDPNDAPWKPAYHGLARAVVRTTLDAATPDAVRALRAAVDTDAGKGPRASAIMPVGDTPPSSLTIFATSPGLQPATLTIALSVDVKDSPLGAAKASIALADLTNGP